MRPCSALPHGAQKIEPEADADTDTGSGVFGVRVQIRRAFVAPCGWRAAKLRSDPKNQLARAFVRCFKPLAQVILAQEAIELIANVRPQPVSESESDSSFPLQNPCECAEERSFRRIRARACSSEASLHETPTEASTAGCPQQSRGTQTPASPFLCLLSFGEAKESRSPTAAKERHRNSSIFQPQFKSKVSDRKPTKRDRAFSGSEPKFPAPSARPTGAVQRNWDLTPKTRKAPAQPVTERIKK